jgi:hypothetical protein
VSTFIQLSVLIFFHRQMVMWNELTVHVLGVLALGTPDITIQAETAKPKMSVALSVTGLAWFKKNTQHRLLPLAALLIDFLRRRWFAGYVEGGESSS